MGEACQGFFKWLFDVTDLLSLWLQLGFNWAQRSHRDTTDQHVVAVQRNPQRKPKNHSDPWEGPSRLPGPPCNHCRYCLLKGRGIMQLPAALFVAGIIVTRRSSNIIIWYDMGTRLQEVCGPHRGMMFLGLLHFCCLFYIFTCNFKSKPCKAMSPL